MKIKKTELLKTLSHDIRILEYIHDRGLKVNYNNFCNFLNWLFGTDYDFRGNKKLNEEFRRLNEMYRIKYS